MSYLNVTLIDVGWGDSILVEASDGANRPRFALIDSNDNTEREYWPTSTFLRKHFGLREDEFKVEKPFFDFVMLTHDHSDHGTGLKRILQQYGSRHFWYPRVDVDRSVILTSLIAYAGHSRVNIDHQAVARDTDVGMLGDVSMNVMWPPPDVIDSNPNNNSVVLSLTVHNQTVLLTGDAEGKVWTQIAAEIPVNTVAFKVPHHGSRNGTLYQGGAPWVAALDGQANPAHLGISCHPNFPNRFDFPHDDVIKRIEQRPYQYYRTDLHYHITFSVTDQGLHVRYSH